jgi:hypothetical protein
MNKNSKKALYWVVNELNKRKIPFALVGGIAANIYGTTRLLNDIDIDIPENKLALVAQELSDYLNFDPEHSISKCFDCQLIGLNYFGQEIELGGAESLKIKDVDSGQWLSWPTDLNAVEWHTYLGLSVPVIAKNKLIAYKKLAGRDVDLLDVKELEKKL